MWIPRENPWGFPELSADAKFRDVSSQIQDVSGESQDLYLAALAAGKLGKRREALGFGQYRTMETRTMFSQILDDRMGYVTLVLGGLNIL